MTGSLTVKRGKYYVVLNVYENGERKKKWINSGLPEKGNKRKAEQFLREKISEYEKMEGLVDSTALFSDYIRHCSVTISVTGCGRFPEKWMMSPCKAIRYSQMDIYFRTLINWESGCEMLTIKSSKSTSMKSIQMGARMETVDYRFVP